MVRIITITFIFNLYIFFLKRFKIKKFLNSSKIIIIYSLSESQIKGFKEIIKEKSFRDDFSIPVIRNADLMVISGKKNFFRVIDKKILIGATNLNLTLFFLLALKGKVKISQIIKSTLAERINLIAANCDVDLFVTNSILGKHHKSFYLMPAKKFVTHCLHYSENSLPVGFGEHLKDSYVSWIAEEPSDFQWVWSEEYAEYIRKVNLKTKVNVVGFVGFDYLPLKPIFKIAVFDVTPVPPGVLEGIHPLHQVDNAKKFISDIVKIKEVINKNTSSMQVVVDIKPKREYKKIHSAEYINFLEDLQQKNKVTLRHFSTNPYELLLNVDLSICAPFTTAAQFGKNMGVPTIYYNYLDKKIYGAISHPVKLIQNYQELLNYVTTLFNKKLDNLKN